MNILLEKKTFEGQVISLQYCCTVAITVVGVTDL